MLRFRQALGALGAIAAMAAAGCSGDGDAVGASAQTDEQREVAARYAKQCDWMNQHRPIDSDLVRETFVAGEPTADGARLYLETDEAEAGSFFQVAVGSDSSEAIDYGTANHIEDSSGDEVKPEHNQLFLLIGLGAPPGEVGPCIAASVPPGIEPGDYTVVVEAEVGDGPEQDLKAPFRVTEPE